jgi:primosomal protein N'
LKKWINLGVFIMEISSILIGLLIFVAALAFVSRPFRQKQRANLKARQADGHSKDRRQSVLAALRDLEFDFKTGKVGEEDYTPLRAQLMVEAAQFIEQEQQEEAKLEALIQTRRVAHEAAILCEHCGTTLEAGQRFCSKCGTAAGQELCPSCGKKNRTGDQFCSSCGSRLTVKLEAVGQS